MPILIIYAFAMSTKFSSAINIFLFLSFAGGSGGSWDWEWREGLTYLSYMYNEYIVISSARSWIRELVIKRSESSYEVF